MQNFRCAVDGLFGIINECQITTKNKTTKTKYPRKNEWICIPYGEINDQYDKIVEIAAEIRIANKMQNRK